MLNLAKKFPHINLLDAGRCDAPIYDRILFRFTLLDRPKLRRCLKHEERCEKEYERSHKQRQSIRKRTKNQPSRIIELKTQKRRHPFISFDLTLPRVASLPPH